MVTPGQMNDTDFYSYDSSNLNFISGNFKFHCRKLDQLPSWLFVSASWPVGDLACQWLDLLPCLLIIAAIALSLEESGKQTKSLYPSVSNSMSTSLQQREPRKVLVVWPTMSCFADWSKCCHVTSVTIECWTCPRLTVRYCKYRTVTWPCITASYPNWSPLTCGVLRQYL